MPAHDDLSLLIEAAKIAGEIATPFWQSDPKIWDKADGAGPVTEADLAVDKALLSYFAKQRPNYGWLSEETTDSTQRQSHDRVVIVDPIDGTRSFIKGDKNWAHSIAIADKGVIIAAVVYLPLLDKLYTATKGQGAFLNDQPISVSPRNDPDGASLLAAPPTLKDHHWRDKAPAFVQTLRPSLAYRLSLVAQGRFDAMLTLRATWEWDVAAGSLIVTEAGGKVIDRNGQIPLFNQPDPRINCMIAGSDGLVGNILHRLQPTP